MDVEKIMGKKRENAGRQHFLPVRNMFLSLNPFPHNDTFWRPWETSLLKTLWEKEKLLIMRSRSSAKVKVKYQGHVSQKMGVSGALVFDKHILFFLPQCFKKTSFLGSLRVVIKSLYCVVKDMGMMIFLLYYIHRCVLWWSTTTATRRQPYRQMVRSPRMFGLNIGLL